MGQGRRQFTRRRDVGRIYRGDVMSKAKAKIILENALKLPDAFFHETAIREAIKELEEEEVTDADIAVLGISSVVFSLVKRIDDLEAWRAKMEGKA